LTLRKALLDELEARRICILLSGGLDSCVLAAVLAGRTQEIHPVYVRSGLVWEEVELHWVRKFLSVFASKTIQPLKEISLPVEDVYNSHWSTTGDRIPNHLSRDGDVYLPGRNLILLAKTSLYCALNHIPVVALGPLKGNPFPDSTPEFFAKFQEMASEALIFDFQIVTPFSDLSKAEVIQLGQRLPLHLTFSCIKPVNHHHCGACNKCAERRRSFLLAEVDDKTHYDSLPTLEP
jgi:7-cyano-7-deazaguanine synthase